jgi:hypothetical protein
MAAGELVWEVAQDLYRAEMLLVLTATTSSDG